MTLIYVDGADVGAITDQGRWAAAGGHTYQASNPRTGSNSIESTTSDERSFSRTLPEAATYIIGFGYYCSALGANDQNIIQLRYQGTNHVVVEQQATTGNLRIKRGDGTVLVDTSTSVTAATYQYIEFKATIHDSAGAVELKIDETSIGSDSSIDTQNGGSALIDQLQITTHAGGSITYNFDDLYICDTAGATNNDFLGNCTVETLFPNAVGTTSDWTALGGGDNYLEVDEQGDADDDTSYVSSKTATEKDTYNMTAISTPSGTVKGVITSAYAKRDSAGTRTIVLVARQGATEGDSSSISLGTDYQYVSNAFETNPDTSAAWTIAELSSAEFGVKVNS